MSQLYLIEQEIARRCGPFLADVTYAPDSTYLHQSSKVAIQSLTSSLGLGDTYTGVQWILRRGWLYGQKVAGGPNVVIPIGVTAADRQRRINGYDSSIGTLTLDRTAAMAIQSSEQIEVMYLNPAQELRVAALAGLDRCYYVDRASVTLTGVSAERDLTALVPWITTPNQVYEVAWAYPGQLYVPYPVSQFRVFQQGNHVWLSVSPDPYPNNLLVYARRAASSAPSDSLVRTVTLVNFTTSTVTSVAHGFVTGERVVLVVGNALIDGTYTITVTSTDTFTLNGRAASVGGDTVVTGTATPLAGVTLPFVDSASGLATSSLLQDWWDYPVTVDYAAAAGVCEAWKKFPAKLTPNAQINLIPTQAMASAELTKQAALNFQPMARRTQFDIPFPAWSTARL